MGLQNPSMKETTVDIFAGNENLFRAYEICMCGDHKLKLISTADEDTAVDAKQMSLLNKHFGEVVTLEYADADILQEIVKPQLKQLLNSKCETIEDVDKRIAAFKERCPDIEINLSEASISLLNTAYERFALQPYEVQIIINIAATIGKMDDSKFVDVVHIAEAIQYRSLDKEFKK